jgi:hypothetical protein
MEMTKFVESACSINKEDIRSLIFDPKDGFLEHIGEALLQTTKCRQECQSGDLDVFIRERFNSETRAKVHVKVLEYLYKVSLVLLHDQEQVFLDEPKHAVTMLRFIDALSWDSHTLLDEQRIIPAPALKQDYTSNLINIGLNYKDLRITKLVALCLSNATSKAWPTETGQSHKLMLSYLTISEVAEEISKKAVKAKDLPNMVSHVIDLQPDRPLNEKKNEPILQVIQEEEGENSSENDQNQSILSTLDRHHSKQSTPLKSTKLQNRAVIGLSDFQSQIASSESPMMIDSSNGHSQKEDLHLIAQQIFEKSYKAFEKQTDAYNIIPFERFVRKFEKYYNDSVLGLEAKLSILQQVTDESSMAGFM